MKYQLIAIIGLFIPFTISAMDSAVETVVVQANKESYVNFITADGHLFKVPSSFILTSKTLKAEYQSKQEFESQNHPSNQSDNEDSSSITITSSIIPSDTWKIIEPHYGTLSSLYTLKKDMRRLKEEYIYVNAFGIFMEELSEQRNSELKQKYNKLKTVPYKDVIEILKNLRLKDRQLRKERAELYTKLYFAFKALSYHQFIDLILLVDFCQIRDLRSVVISLAYRLPQLHKTIPTEEQRALPEAFMLDMESTMAGRRRSVLHWACSRGMLSVVKDVVENEGAQLEERNSEGNTPLNIAAIEDYADIVIYLLSKNANTETINFAAYTPLQNACKVASHETIQPLLGKGSFFVNRSVPTRWGMARYELPATPCETALHLACRNKESAELVYNYYRQLYRNLLEFKNDCGNTPLMEASKRQSDETVRFLLEQGANVRATNNVNRTALHEACDCTNYDLVVALVEAEAPLNVVEASQNTPLHIACMLHDNIAVVRYLATRQGIDLGKTDKFGETPLQIAASWRNLKLVQFFMEECARGFDDLKKQDLDSYGEPVRSYLKQRKKILAQRAQDEKEEQARLFARAQNK